jgi:hypothetical protein
MKCSECVDEIVGVAQKDLDGKHDLCEGCFQERQDWSAEKKAEYIAHLEWLEEEFGPDPSEAEDEEEEEDEDEDEDE